jgi:cell division protein FtsZ
MFSQKLELSTQDSSESPVIKVVGVGGGGCNAVDRMVATGMTDVEFIAVNTDIQALRMSQAATRICIGNELARGMGSGSKPVVGQQAAEASRHELARRLAGADMVCIAAGMGGGTGTGAAPVIAEIARDQGALTVAVVTRPFSFEGRYRAGLAEQGLNQLRAAADTVVVVPNDRLLQLATRNTSITQAFALADGVLHSGVQSIADLIVNHGLINVDFADVRAIMSQAGMALMAIGVGEGPQRCVEAVRKAINSPLLEVGIEGARGVLFNITGGADLGLLEVHSAADVIAQAVDPDANIIFGAVIDERIPVEQVKVTLIATSFGPQPAAPRRRLLPKSAPQQSESSTERVGRLLRPIKSRQGPPEPPSLSEAPVDGLMARPVLLQARSKPPERDQLDIPPFLRRSVRNQDHGNRRP